MAEDGGRRLHEQIVDLDDVPVAILGVAKARQAPAIVDGNLAFQRLIGFSRRELRGAPLTLLRADATDAEHFEHLLDAVRRGDPLALMVQLRTARGMAWIDLRGHPLAGEHHPYALRLYDAPIRQIEGPVRGQRDSRAALAEMTSEGVYHLRVAEDCRLVLEWTGGAFSRLTGFRLEEIEAAGGWTSLIDPADLRVVQRRAQRLLAGEEAVAEYRVRTAGGQHRWLHDRGRPILDRTGELVTGALCLVQDVTEQRRLEAEAVARENEQQALTGLLDGLLLQLDERGRILASSGRVSGPLSARLHRGAGQFLDELLDPARADAWRAKLAVVRPDQPPIRFEGEGDTPEERYQIRASATSNGRILALLSLCATRAPTPPALTAPCAASGDSRLQALLEAHPGAMVVLSPDLRVEGLNQAAERLTGWQQAAALGRPFIELLALADEGTAITDDLERARAGVPVAFSEGWLRLPGGQAGRVFWSFTPLRQGAHAVLGVLAQGEAIAPRVDLTPVSATDRVGLRAVIDHLAEGIVTLDRQGSIIAFSPTAETIFGYRRGEITGQAIETLLLQSGGPGQPLRDLLQHAGGHELQNMLARRKGGEIVPVEVALSEITSNGEAIFILTIRDVTVRNRTEETIRNLAYHDPLTGLPNRLLFNDRLSQAIERARRNHQVLAVMILDIDRFKLINDSLGLASGDQVLRAIGERLVGTVRKSDTVARLGGDDFLLLLPGVEGAENAAKVAQKLLDALGPLLPVEGQELHIGASVGIAMYPHDGEDFETLIRNADTALYRAKERSRGSYQFYTTDMNATAFERLVLETQLRKALERQELVLHYQPQVRLDTGDIVGVEALVRWQHPDLGMIPPAEFIPLAEETGLILAIGRWVLMEACAQVRLWQERGFADLRLAVNLSGRQFQQSDLVCTIADVLDESALDPEDLELELTESSIMQDAETVVAKCEALHGLGIKLSIDDFGTGYSSLAHLKRFPIKALKIDQSFIQDITVDPNDAAIAQAIIALAETLKLRVIAEGVETMQQLELLKRYHCDEMQGYLFSRPLPAEELLSLLEAQGQRRH